MPPVTHSPKLSSNWSRLSPVDLALYGKQAIDGDAAQVGPEIASHLGYSQFTYVAEIKEIDETKRYITVKRKAEGGFVVANASEEASCMTFIC